MLRLDCRRKKPRLATMCNRIRINRQGFPVSAQNLQNVTNSASRTRSPAKPIVASRFIEPPLAAPSLNFHAAEESPEEIELSGPVNRRARADPFISRARRRGKLELRRSEAESRGSIYVQSKQKAPGIGLCIFERAAEGSRHVGPSPTAENIKRHTIDRRLLCPGA